MKRSRTAELTESGARDLARLLAEGNVRAEEVTEAHLERIASQDGAVRAWAHVDADYALAQARALDRHRGTGRALGPLHGVPVGVKDIIDVRGLPGENGTEIDAGRRPRQDATAVSRLREAGAVILGKTVTTELAVFQPGPTRNPLDPERTPGGSSSGSAAAVAANMVSLALGTQTNGSVIRPAAYCGVVGFKPSRGLVSRHGVLSQSPALDTMGTLARSIEDVALLTDAVAGHDPADAASELAAAPKLLATALSRPPVRPAIAFVPTAVWGEAEEDVREGFAELAGELAPGIDEVPLPEVFDRAIELHRTIHLADLAKSYGGYYDKAGDRLSPRLREMIEEGRTVLAVDYALAHDWIDVLNAGLDRLFDRYDAILTPAAAGEAPGIESTGSPAFCTLWTYCGVPAVTLPLLSGANGLPIGVQLVGRRGQDARLLRTARWLIETLREDAQGGREVA